MVKEVLIAKNITREGPGLIELVLTDREISYKIIDLSAGESIPQTDTFDILIIMGGPDSANDPTEKMRNELERIKEAIDSEKPYLGICLGLQTLVKAAGGQVVKGSVKEIGFRNQAGEINPINLTDAGIADPLFNGLSDSLRVFHLHGETVQLTDEMLLLGTGKDVKNQIVKIGNNAYGIQCHFELTPEMLETWLREDFDLHNANQEQIRQDFQEFREEYTRIGRKLINNFLDIATKS